MRGTTRERAVVVTVTVIPTGVEPSSVTELGETVQVAPCGAPVQLSDTSPVNPLGVISRLKVAVCPAVTVAVVEDPEGTSIEKSTAPVPTMPMISGLPAASWWTTTAPRSSPGAVGMKVTLMLQLAPTAKEAGERGQSLVGARVKSGSAKVMLLITRAAVPVLVSATVFGSLAVPTG
jgi:hypothetical protein